jgi:hypothetical protein
MPRVIRIRMYASRSGLSPRPAAFIVSRKRASIAASDSGTSSASMAADLRSRVM